MILTVSFNGLILILIGFGSIWCATLLDGYNIPIPSDFMWCLSINHHLHLNHLGEVFEKKTWEQSDLENNFGLKHLTQLKKQILRQTLTHTKHCNQKSAVTFCVLPWWLHPGSPGTRQVDSPPQATAAHSWWLCRPSAEAARLCPLWRRGVVTLSCIIHSSQIHKLLFCILHLFLFCSDSKLRPGVSTWSFFLLLLSQLTW